MARKPVNASPDTRENLLRLAARLFGTQGYAATSMRAIAEQAGIEVASIYHHFSSKEQLVDTVMTHGVDSLVGTIRAHVDGLPPGADAEQRFRAAMVGQMTAMVRFGDYALASGRLLAQLPDEARERQVKRRQQHQEYWGKLLEDLRDEGFLRPDADLALCRIFVLGAINNIQTWFNPRKGSIEKVADELCRIFFEGTRPAASKRAGRKSALAEP